MRAYGCRRRRRREGAAAVRRARGGSPEDGSKVGQEKPAHNPRQRTPVWGRHQPRHQRKDRLRCTGHEAGDCSERPDGAYRSQQCSVCGFVHPDDRPGRAALLSRACGHTGNAIRMQRGTSLSGLSSTSLVRSAPHTRGEVEPQAGNEHDTAHAIMLPARERDG